MQDLGIDAVTFPTSGTSEDAAMLLADEHGADARRRRRQLRDAWTSSSTAAAPGMASSFLTRLRLGAKVVDAQTVRRLYRTRISGAALLLLVIAALVAVVAVLAISDAGRTYLTGLHSEWNQLVNWLQDKFS